MPKVNRKTACFCSRNYTYLFVNIGGMFREKYFFKGGCRFGVAHTILEWDFYFESRLLCSCAEFTYFLFYDLDGNKRQKRQEVQLRTPCRYLLKPLNILSSSFSSTLSNFSSTCCSNSFSS